MTAAVRHRPRRSSSWFTASYGLRHCEGYRVVGPQGPGGYVEEVRLDGEGQPVAIVVGGRRRRLVPAGQIRSVDDGAELVRLTSAPPEQMSGTPKEVA